MPESYRTLPIVWIAMMIAVVTIGVVTFAGVVPTTEGDPIIPYVLAIPAVVTGAMSAIGVRMFMGRQPAQTAYILRFSFAESVAIFGLMSHSQGAPTVVVGLHFAASLALMALARPTPDAFTEWEMRRGA